MLKKSPIDDCVALKGAKPDEAFAKAVKISGDPEHCYVFIKEKITFIDATYMQKRLEEDPRPCGDYEQMYTDIFKITADWNNFFKSVVTKNEEERRRWLEEPKRSDPPYMKALRKMDKVFEVEDPYEAYNEADKRLDRMVEELEKIKIRIV